MRLCGAAFESRNAGNMASPTPEVDEFWRQQIINTKRYGPDCACADGRFPHHSFLEPNDPAQSHEIQLIWLAALDSLRSPV
jgi:hypothetical protein